MRKLRCILGRVKHQYYSSRIEGDVDFSTIKKGGTKRVWGAKTPYVVINLLTKQKSIQNLDQIQRN